MRAKYNVIVFHTSHAIHRNCFLYTILDQAADFYHPQANEGRFPHESFI